MTVTLALSEGIATLTIDRQETLNALNFSLISDIAEKLDEVRDSAARGLLITGAGEKAFCAGADIKELMGRDLMAQKRGAEAGQATFAKIAALEIPSLALINGFAFGGGLEMALACTFRMAVPTAKMGLPEIKLGLIPGYGGTQRLPRLIGEGRALEMILTGRTVDAEEAHRIGLVNRLAETADPVAEAQGFLGEVTRYGLPAISFAKEAVTRALDLPIHEGLKVEADLSTLSFRTEDADEGLAAFVEKRKPSFKDR
ncbi:enoyl-CoA hydratase-related protein [Thalassobaculum sp. OXR-137]|uniref:enoyl-CoA hydratase/isomerase family protein n=1 Tax=Thalassobaculum sp. OXR-137 TaxID=3100173 RepID=UPI002AC8DA67|nr:enoyl-CoA hydratase-related protein [Thalassobaculum sp. OXR-137]WPZ33017.1 enoyl-CoA hydratase-related protein [Thalassobaculum sp. OXR-137]